MGIYGLAAGKFRGMPFLARLRRAASPCGHSVLLRKVVDGLQPHPGVGVTPSELFQRQGYGWGDALLAVEQPAQGIARDADSFGAFGQGPAHRVDVGAEAAAWVGRVEHVLPPYSAVQPC